MAGSQILSTVKYVAGTKKVFFLSEISEYLDVPMTVDKMYAILQPHLLPLGLDAKRSGKDYEISRIKPGPAYTMSAAEEKCLETYLAETTFPPSLEEAIKQYITRKTGKPWSDPAILDRLRQAIVAQKNDYWKPTEKRTLQYTKGYSVLGYLVYHFPVYFMQTRHLLAILAREGLLKQEMNVLDLGTGPGVIPLAIADFWKCVGRAKVNVWTLERSKEHIEAFEYLLKNTTKKNPGVTINSPAQADITSPKNISLPPCDLIVFSNVLNELTGFSEDSRADLVMEYAKSLSPDGSILIVEPAEEVTATGLRILALALKKRGLTIYAPCVFIWGTNCTPDRCWSFTTAHSIKPTELMNTLSMCEEPFRYVNTDIKYSYVILRKDAKKRHSCSLTKSSKATRLSRLHLKSGNRISVTVAKMSENLGNNKNYVFKICDGSAEKPVYAILPSFHTTASNRTLVTAPYGTVLEISDVHVRFNPAYQAFNVLVTRNSRASLAK